MQLYVGVPKRVGAAGWACGKIPLPLPRRAMQRGPRGASVRDEALFGKHGPGIVEGYVGYGEDDVRGVQVLF